MESEGIILKKKMLGIAKEIKRFTGLKLKKMPDVDLREQSFPFYSGEKNLIIWGKKSPLGKPIPERKLVEELTHAILHQNQKEWLPSGLHEYFSKYCAVMLRPLKNEELEDGHTGQILIREMKDVREFRKTMTLLENVGIQTNLFVTKFCTTFNKMLSETIGERLGDIDFEALKYFDHLNNPIEYPISSYYASAEDIAKATGVDEEQIQRSLEKIKTIAKITYADGTKHSILMKIKRKNYMTDFQSIVDWVFEIANRYASTRKV